jgi:hypothetical protein
VQGCWVVWLVVLHLVQEVPLGLGARLHLCWLGRLALSSFWAMRFEALAFQREVVWLLLVRSWLVLPIMHSAVPAACFCVPRL